MLLQYEQAEHVQRAANGPLRPKNHGRGTMRAKSAGSRSLMAFEGQTDTFRCLKTNVKLSRPQEIKSTVLRVWFVFVCLFVLESAV